MHVLVTRPDPAATVARWRALGWEVTAAPLFVVRGQPWVPPATMPDAVAFTSVNGVAFAGPGAAPLAGLPVFAVGPATARSAAAAGWHDVRDGGGSAATLFDRIAAAGFASVLHLAGAARVAVTPPPGLTIVVRVVYAAMPVALPAAAIGALVDGVVDAVPLYSARAAAHFAAEVDRANVARGGIDLAALSPAVAATAGSGWRRVEVAAVPTDDALFAATLRLCDKAVTGREG